VLPLPDPPMIPKTVWGRTSNDTPRRMRLPPAVFTRSVTRIIVYLNIPTKLNIALTNSKQFPTPLLQSLLFFVTVAQVGGRGAPSANSSPGNTKTPPRLTARIGPTHLPARDMP